MPLHFDTVFFSKNQTTYRLHFPYMLGDVDKSMLSIENGDRFTSDIREYIIRGYIFSGATYDIFVREIGADIFPGRIDAWFFQGGSEASIPLDLLENIKIRKEEATQNRIAVTVNGKPV